MRDKRDEFKLRIAGKSLGNHKFSLVCDQKFFEIAGITELQGGTLNLEINMEKRETMINFSFRFEGDVTALCDRCLDPVSFPMNIDETLIVKLVSSIEEREAEDDMIWMIQENEYELDLFHFVYETIRLALPLQIIHPENSDGTSMCNPEVIKQLNKLSQRETPLDTRWDALKNIKLD